MTLHPCHDCGATRHAPISGRRNGRGVPLCARCKQAGRRGGRRLQACKRCGATRSERIYGKMRRQKVALCPACKDANRQLSGPLPLYLLSFLERRRTELLQFRCGRFAPAAVVDVTGAPVAPLLTIRADPLLRCPRHGIETVREIPIMRRSGLGQRLSHPEAPIGAGTVAVPPHRGCSNRQE